MKITFRPSKLYNFWFLEAQLENSYFYSYLIESPESTDVEDDDIDDETRAVIIAFGTPRRKRTTKFGQLRLPRVKHFGGSARQRLGARKMRRIENGGYKSEFIHCTNLI